jgi:hypothetical protein
MNWKSSLCSLALVLAFGVGHATEGRVTRADLAEIRAVINRQIDAFRRDDAQGAFALVSPGMQLVFGPQQRFSMR